MSNLFRLMKMIQRGLGSEPSPRRGGGGRRRERGGRGDEDDSLLRVDPRETDPGLSEWLDPHIVAVDPSVPATGNLVLFLPGSYGHPGRQTAILKIAAAAGHRAINLTYPNSWTVGGLCRKSPDPEAHAKLRRQIIEGTPESGLVSMPAADGIINRLVKCLQWLERTQPGGGWGAFLAGEEPRRENIVVAGHSQGGGHAAFIGKMHEVAKVIMLGAPADFSAVNRRLASWLYWDSATPAERYFGFCHRRDPAFERAVAAWGLLGMEQFGPLVDTDLVASPYRYSHSLTTDQAAAGDKFHGSVATDAAAPRGADGRIIFAPVWDYLFRA